LCWPRSIFVCCIFFFCVHNSQYTLEQASPTSDDCRPPVWLPSLSGCVQRQSPFLVFIACNLAWEVENDFQTIESL
jgi:hypothetical protein